MGIIATCTNQKLRGGGFTTVASSSPSHRLLVVVIAYCLAAILILQGAVTPAAAAKMQTANSMDDPSDMIEDFAREVMEESIVHM